MKIIHTSDWHLGKTLNHYSLLEDQRAWFQRFIDQMKEIRPDVILAAGDIYDRSVPPAEAVELLHDILCRIRAEIGCPVILTAGNHDSGKRLSFGAELMEISNVYLVGRNTPDMKKITLHDSYGPVNFYAVPYYDVHTIRSMIELPKGTDLNRAFHTLCADMLAHMNPAERNVLVAHGFFAAASDLTASDGSQVGGSELISLLPFSGFDYIALGHIHMPKHTGLPHARYSGSPLKYSVDEANHKKSVSVVDLAEKGTLHHSTIEIPALRDVRIVRGEFAEIMARKYLTEGTEQDYVFFQLTDTVPVVDAVSQLKSLYPNILGLRFESLEQLMPVQASSLEKIEGQSTFSLFADFYESYLEAGLSDFQSETAQEILRKLEGTI